MLLACGNQDSGKTQPLAKKGIIDLSNWDFKSDGPVQLNGEWLFVAEQFVQPKNNRDLSREFRQKINIPEDPTNDAKSLSLGQSKSEHSSYSSLYLSLFKFFYILII